MIKPFHFSARRRAGAYYPSAHRLRRFWHWLGEQGPRARLASRLAVTAAVSAHLLAAALLPGGRNTLFQIDAPAVLGYLTLAPVGDTMGFFKTAGRDGFVVYRVFTEGGKVVEGAFPDPIVTPRLRYDRWAMFAHYASGDQEMFHSAFVNYLVGRLSVPPLKVEMLAARWAWPGGRPRNGNGTRPGERDEMTLELRSLGTYDGVRREWTPVRRQGKK